MVYKYFKYLLFLIAVTTTILAESTVGLIYHDSTKTLPGYTLFAPNAATTTYLIDMNGKLVHQWESKYGPYLSAYLLENGYLLRSAVVKHPADPTDDLFGGFQLFNWDNILVWEYYNDYQHHDIEYIPESKNVLVIIEDTYTSSEAIAAGLNPALITGLFVRSVSIIEVKQIGLDSAKIVWRWNAWDHLIQDHDNTKINFGMIDEHPELININYNFHGQDWLHTNSIDYNEDLDQIIFSNRNINEIWIIDHSTTIEEAASHSGGNYNKGGDLLYRWGNPTAYNAGSEADRKLFEQHDANWIDDGLNGEGNILIFNNGLGRPEGLYSSVIEIEPPLNNLGLYDITMGTSFAPINPIWEYSSDPLESFSSPKYGGSQRLINGNTLICNSNSGEFIEVTPDQQVVWRYISPVNTLGIVEQGTIDVGSNQVFRCYRYAPNYPGLADKDLMPGNPIERYPLSVENGKSPIKVFKLEQNFPNPFNHGTSIKFNLTERLLVTLIIYDLFGNNVRTLIDGYLEPGIQNTTWDALDENGNPVSSGVYLYSIKTGSQSLSKKMILLR